MHRGFLLAFLLVTGVPSEAAAQQPRPYVGATFNGLSHLDSVGSSFTSSTGAVVVGAASPRLIVEFEASFGGSTSSGYSYYTGGGELIEVATTARESSFIFQLKGRGRIFEPVVGMGFIHYRVAEHAVGSWPQYHIPPRPYFDQGHSNLALVVSGGLDAAVKVMSHLYFVPSVRLIVSLDDPLKKDAQSGRVRLRYGAGIRVGF